MQKGKLFLEFRKDISSCQGSKMGTRGWTPASAQKRRIWLSYDSREPMKELGRVKGRTPSVFTGLSLKNIAAGWWTASRLLRKLLVPAGVLQAVQHFHSGPGLMLCGWPSPTLASFSCQNHILHIISPCFRSHKSLR